MTRPLTVDHARDLATQLIRTLAPLAGDDEAVTDELMRWDDVLGVRDLSLVALATVQMVFVDCLTPADHQPDRLALVAPLDPEGVA